MLEEVIAQRLQIPLPRVQGTVRLLRDGATIPFISRYRKEATGSLDEVQVAAVKEWLDRLTELETRRQTILDTIEGQGVLTSELRRRIDACWDPTELEDLYLPYKPRRRTRATIARERGLEPLADLLQAQQTRDFAQQARRFVTAQVPTPEEAIAGACDIVAERIAEDERVRNRLRKIFVREGLVRSKVVKGKESEGAKYAELDYKVLETNAEKNISLLRVDLVTGRAHQIRVQMAQAGTPVLGDLKYGRGERFKLPLCLWAAELRFAHPVSGKTMDFRVYPPERLPWTLFNVERYLGITISDN